MFRDVGGYGFKEFLHLSVVAFCPVTSESSGLTRSLDPATSAVFRARGVAGLSCKVMKYCGWFSDVQRDMSLARL